MSCVISPGRRMWRLALQESQERYQQLVDLSPDAVVVHSDGNVVFANQAAFRLIGAKSMDDIKNHSASQLTHHLDPFTIAHDSQTAASKAHTQLFETHSFRLDGQELDIEMIACAVKLMMESQRFRLWRGISQLESVPRRLSGKVKRIFAVFLRPIHSPRQSFA